MHLGSGRVRARVGRVLARANIANAILRLITRSCAENKTHRVGNSAHPQPHPLPDHTNGTAHTTHAATQSTLPITAIASPDLIPAAMNMKPEIINSTNPMG